VPIQSESELYHPVKAFLEQAGYTVRGEVEGCDLVAMKAGAGGQEEGGDPEEPVIVELKKTFNLPLLYQAIERLELTGRVYVAVEETYDGKRKSAKKWKNAVRLCRMLGLGLMTVRFGAAAPRVTVHCDPEPYRPRRNKNKAARLRKEFRDRSGDHNIGGVRGVELVTAYREKALACAFWLREKGPLSPRELRALTRFERAGDIVYDNYYGWFERERRGVYRLTPAGEEALARYGRILEEWRAGGAGANAQSGTGEP
jgi:hypothetical protein